VYATPVLGSVLLGVMDKRTLLLLIAFLGVVALAFVVADSVKSPRASAAREA